MNLSDLFAPDEQGAETRIDLEQAIGRLTFREAAVLYLWAVCEKSQAEIGAIIGLSQARICQILANIYKSDS
jgi:RNA polymerase sigma factor FliA